MKKETYERMKGYLNALVEFGMHGKLHRHQRMCIFWEIKKANDWIRKYEMGSIEYLNLQTDVKPGLILQSKMN